MLSRTILAQSILSEDQFIADLTSLFRRRNISFGEPQDLDRLASDLVADGAFRAALFNLCVVISHMGEVEFTPRELLVLVARASGGPGIIDAEGNIIIPHDTESAFLTGYEAWIHRDPDLEAASERRHSAPFHAAMEMSAAEGPRTEPRPPGPPQPPRPIPSNAPLDSLTLAELRQYLDEIERRVSQIEPHLDQVARTEQAARNTSPSAAHFEQLDALESERIHEIISFPAAVGPAPAPIEETPAPTPGPELAAESVPPSAPVEEAPTLAAELITPAVLPAEEAPALDAVPILSTEPPAPAIQPEAADAALDAARLRRLRAANIILAVLLIISTVFAGFVAYRYVNSMNQPPSLAAIANQPPAAAIEPATPATALQSTPRTTPSTTHPATAPGHDTKPPQTSEAVSAAPPDAVVYPPAATPPEATSPAPVVRQAPEPASTAPTQAASTPATPPPAEARPAESAARPAQQNDVPPRPQVAVATPAAAPATAPAPSPHPPEPVSATVNVSSSKMMAYATAKPAPVPPPTWHGNRETTVEVVAIISKEGKVTSAQALSGTPDVRPAAIQAMEAWRFKPYLVNGKPVEVITTFKFLFKGQ